MNTFQFNKLSELHDGYKIFFTKTDYLLEDLVKISKLKHEVILITGNSDLVIDKEHLRVLPPNVKMWFATNAIVSHERIITIPLGIENYEPAKRAGHGVGYDRVKDKDKFISTYVERVPTKFVYSNFNVFTNYKHRNDIRTISIETPHIDWEEPNLSIDSFFDKILDYEGVICAQGNGPDTHRVYETLYLNRIPITFNKPLYELLYHKFPIVYLDDQNELRNFEKLSTLIKEQQTKEWNKELLNIEYWKKIILSYQ
jgi:hypothetical protein